MENTIVHKHIAEVLPPMKGRHLVIMQRKQVRQIRLRQK